MHHSAKPSGLLSMLLSTMLSRLLSTLVMKGKERKGKEREGERLAPPGISIFVQQALQPASCIFKGATLRAVHVSVSTGSSPATASSPKHRQDRRRPSLGLGMAPSVAGGGRGRPVGPRRRFRERLGVRVTRGLQDARWSMGRGKTCRRPRREGATERGGQLRLRSPMFHSRSRSC